MDALIKYFAKQSTLINIITVFVIVLGIYSLFKINREVFPNINFDIVNITTTYPGASAESVEKLITNTIEQDLMEIDGIKKLTSVSSEGISVIMLQLDPDLTTGDEVEKDAQDIVDAITDLPEDAEDPIITQAESSKRPTITVSVSGAVDDMTLRANAKKLEGYIESLPEVSKVNYQGLRDIEYRVSADPAKLRSYAITLQDIINSLAGSNLNLPGGTLKAGEDGTGEMIIRTISDLETVADIEKTVIRANAIGRPILVKDVASVKISLSEAKKLYRTNGINSINMTVLRNDGKDAINLVDKLKAMLEDKKSTLDKGIEVNYINDSSYFVRRRLKVLSSNLAVGLGLVLIILSLVLPWRVAAVTSFGIPFSFLGAIAIFYFGGVSLNLISMMGLIIVIGMLVDDAIVVTENAQSEIESHEGDRSIIDSAIVATQQIWRPVTASVLTTVFAFLPLMYMSGIFGKFIRFIPLGVVIALMVSLWECFFILPHHVGSWIRPKDGIKSTWISRLFSEKLNPLYSSYVEKAYNLRYLIIVISIGFVAGSIVFASKNVPFILFPASGIEQFNIRLETPSGTSLERTSMLVKPIEKAVSQLSKVELQDYTTTIGHMGSNDQNDRKSGAEYAQVSVYLTAELERERSAQEIIAGLKEKIGTPEGFTSIKIEQRRGGPPVGKPVSVGIRGKSYGRIMEAIDEVTVFLEGIDGVTDLQNTYVVGKKEVHVKVDPIEAAAANLSLANIGTSIRAAFEGVKATTIKELEEEIDVVVDLKKENKSSLKALETLEITNARGNLIPLPSVAKWSPERGIASYEHQNNRRQVRIIGEINEKITNARAVEAQVKNFVKTIKHKYPDLAFTNEGEASDTKESLGTLIASFAFAFFAILMLLILLFKNIYQPLLVATTIPLSIVAVVWTFYFSGAPLSFLAAIGLIALSGVIVNNAIVIMDFVNAEKLKGLVGKDALKTACAKRLRPIFLTTVTTTAGILPTAYGWGGLDPFVVPIALALGWGMLFGAILTLVVFPAYAALGDDFERVLNLFTKNKQKGIS